MTNPPPDLAIPDRVLVAGRWIAAFVGIVSSLPAAERADKSLAYASTFIIGIATWRTVRPFQRLEIPQRRIWLVFELLTTAVAVAVSGAWASPFTSSLIVVTMLASLSEDVVGAWLAIVGLLFTVLTIGAFSDAKNLLGVDFARLFTTISVAAVVGVAVRRAFSRMRSQAITQTGELQRLADTNALMVRLTKLTRAGETIREPRDIATEAASRFAVSFAASFATVLHRSEQGGEWMLLAEHHGTQAVSLPEPGHTPRLSYTTEELTPILGTALFDGPGPTTVEPYASPRGLSGAPGATLVAPLLVRTEVIGAVVLERAQPFSAEERQRLTSMCEVLGLSIDNSRWFRRLRSMGAEDERSRIARELHDRLASSVAYSAFAFERLRQHYVDDKELAKAHEEARTTVGDLRDLLWQLRTGVTAASPLSVVGVDLARRFSNRTGIQTTFTVDHEARLPLPVEVELLRITQEALNNVEKHAGATSVSIVYEPAIPMTRLTIRDNGVGFNPESTISSDSYGLSGIRERADAIGATVQITSAQGADSGTTIALALPSDEGTVTVTTVEPLDPLENNDPAENHDHEEHPSVPGDAEHVPLPPRENPAEPAFLPTNSRPLNAVGAPLHEAIGLRALGADLTDNANPTQSSRSGRELPIEQNVRSRNHENPVWGSP
jgi:signal transduction histidine kinase